MAVTKATRREWRDGDVFQFELTAGASVYQGALVEIAPAGTVANLVKGDVDLIAGVALESKTAGAAEAGVIVNVRRRGVFKFKNAADPNDIDKANIGDHAYAVDNETVTDTAGGGTSIGYILGLDADGGVWVDLTPDLMFSKT